MLGRCSKLEGACCFENGRFEKNQNGEHSGISCKDYGDECLNKGG